MGKNLAVFAIVLTAGLVLAVAAKKLVDERREQEDADAIVDRIDAKLSELELNSPSHRAAVQAN